MLPESMSKLHNLVTQGDAVENYTSQVDEAIAMGGKAWQEEVESDTLNRIKSLISLSLRTGNLYVMDVILTAVEGGKAQESVYADTINEILSNSDMLSSYIDEGAQDTLRPLHFMGGKSPGDMVESLLASSSMDSDFLRRSDLGDLFINLLSVKEDDHSFSQILDLLLTKELDPLTLSQFSRSYFSSIGKYTGGDPLQSGHYDQQQYFVDAMKDKVGYTLFFPKNKTVPLMTMLLSALLMSSKNNGGSETNMTDFIKYLIDEHALDVYADRPSAYDLIIKGCPAILGTVENYVFNKRTDQIMTDETTGESEDVEESASQFLL